MIDAILLYSPSDLQVIHYSGYASHSIGASAVDRRGAHAILRGDLHDGSGGGSIAAKPMGGKRNSRLKDERDWLLARVAAAPDLSLHDLRRELQCLCRLWHDLALLRQGEDHF